MINNHTIVLGKREGKHARDKSHYAEASPHFSKKKERKQKEKEKRGRN